jgi:hypothetical protein
MVRGSPGRSKIEFAPTQQQWMGFSDREGKRFSYTPIAILAAVRCARVGFTERKRVSELRHALRELVQYREDRQA